MRNRARTLVGLVILCLGFAVGSAEAAESRVGSFTIPCDGTNHDVTFTVGGLGNSVSRFIQSAEVALFENHGGLQFLFLSVAAANKVLLVMSAADNRASQNYISSLYQTTTSPTGTVTFVVSGVCNAGFGQVQGFAIIVFFS
jgi:hypothetical protein